MHVCCIYDTYPDDITLQFSHIAMVFDLPRAPEAQRLSVRCTWPGIKTTIGPWRRVRRYSVPVCLVLLLWWFVFRFSEMRRLWYRNEPLVNVYIANWNSYKWPLFSLVFVGLPEGSEKLPVKYQWPCQEATNTTEKPHLGIRWAYRWSIFWGVRKKSHLIWDGITIQGSIEMIVLEIIHEVSLALT